MLELYLFRHAECELNKVFHYVIGGRTNESPLTLKGKAQSELLGERLLLENVSFSEIYSSTAVRTIETARITAGILGLPLEKIMQREELQELDQGEWEGKLRRWIYTPEILAEINANNRTFRPPGGESQKDVEERMLGFIHKYLLPRYKQDLTVGLFTHGVAIKCLFRGIMNSDPSITYKIAVENTSITRFRYNEKGWHLLCLNDCSHLLK